MDKNNPCIIYQRLRPSEPEASEYARQTVWPMADELVVHKGYVVAGRYGDSEFAPPFCGGSEIRPGFQSAIKHAEEIAAEAGTCTLIVGDASPIGSGDPFLPACLPGDGVGGVQVSLVNLHLQPDIIAVPLRLAWEWFHRDQKVQTHPPLIDLAQFGEPTSEIEVFVRREPERLLASLYVANPTPSPLTLRWTQLLQRPSGNTPEIHVAGRRDLDIPSGHGAHLLDIYQGELLWARQFRFNHEDGGEKRVGSSLLLCQVLPSGIQFCSTLRAVLLAVLS